jgi:hypothetical protein
VVTSRLEIKIYINNVIGAIPIEFNGLVLANESALVPKDSPCITPWIIDIKL